MAKLSNKYAILDYLGICLMVFLIIFILAVISLNLVIFNPFLQAMNDFKMTDVYFELMHSNEEKELSKDIVLVDITELTERDSLAKTIADVNSCDPKTVMIDLIFERPSYDQINDIALVNAVLEGKDKEILSSKLTDYDPHGAHFTHQVKSFFHEIDNFNWAYSNMEQVRPGGSIRQYTLSQRLNDSLSYSMPYMAACSYLGIQPELRDNSQRLIIYGDTDFLTIPYNKVRESKELLQGKLVIIGALEEEADKHITPIGKQPGMKILAYSAHTFIHHKDIKTMGQTANFIVAFLVCLFCAWGGHAIKKRFSTVTSYIMKIFYFLVTAFIVWIAFIMFVHFDYNISLLLPLLSMAFVEEGRLQYSSLIKVLGKYTHWKFLKKSIYYGK